MSDANKIQIRAVLSDDAIEKDLPEFCKAKGYNRVLILTGETTGRVIGDNVRNILGQGGIDTKLFDHFTRIDKTRLDSVYNLVRDRDFNAVIGAGGGKNIDGAKLVADQLNVPSIAVPSRLSNDGLISPAATRGEGRYLNSEEANPPVGVFVDYKYVETPENFGYLSSAAADLYTKFFSVRDWEIAHELGNSEVPINESSRLLALNAAKRIKKMVEEKVNIWDRSSIDTLFNGLIESGTAMIYVNSTRPASGADHKIAHGVNAKLTDGLSHGYLVSVGTELSSKIYSLKYKEKPHGEGPEDVFAMRKFFKMPLTLQEYGISEDVLVDGVAYAMSKIRPFSKNGGIKGRYTILEKAKDDRLFDASNHDHVRELISYLFV